MIKGKVDKKTFCFLPAKDNLIKKKKTKKTIQSTQTGRNWIYPKNSGTFKLSFYMCH